MDKLNNITKSWMKSFVKPLIISGPCSAESYEQLVKTAKILDKSYVKIFRAGIWKPRTRPNTFEGIGLPGLKWLKKIKNKMGFLIATEVANAYHVEKALEYDIDVLWIGARSTASPFTVQEIANVLENTKKIILIKNPIHPDIELWIGSLERLLEKGIKKLGLIHRGFFLYKDYEFRNQPNWKLVLDLKNRYPNIPIFCDPSHICGNRKKIFEIIQKAYKFKYDGYMIETHYNPNIAWSDANQQILPEKLTKIFQKIKKLENIYNSEYEKKLECIRFQINELDKNILSLFYQRMKLTEEVGRLKKIYGIPVFQPKRLEEILLNCKKYCKHLNISEKFIEKIFKILHKESVRIQNKIIINNK